MASSKNFVITLQNFLKMKTKLSTLFTEEEYKILLNQMFLSTEIFDCEVQKLTLKDLLNLSLPLMMLEKVQDIESKNLCVEAIKILWRRAIERHEPIF